jgi:hypothetical protein
MLKQNTRDEEIKEKKKKGIRRGRGKKEKREEDRKG